LQAGIHPEIAIATSGLFNDPMDVFTQSKRYLDKWEPVTMLMNEMLTSGNIPTTTEVSESEQAATNEENAEKTASESEETSETGRDNQ